MDLALVIGVFLIFFLEGIIIFLLFNLKDKMKVVKLWKRSSISRPRRNNRKVR